MKPFFKLIIIFLVIPSLIGLYFFDNIKGYWRFKQYCAKDSGLKIYQKAESDKGWLVDSRSAAREVAVLSGVKFARFKDIKTDEYFDVEYISGSVNDNSSFKIGPSDFNIPTEYKWAGFSQVIKGELRLGKYGSELFDNNNNKIMGFYRFSYAKFNRDNMPLDMNPYVICDSPGMASRLTYEEYWAAIKSVFF